MEYLKVYNSQAEQPPSLVNVVTKNLENILVREREISQIKEEIREDLDASSATLNNMDDSIVGEQTVKALNLITNGKKTEEMRRRILFFLFILIIFMVSSA